MTLMHRLSYANINQCAPQCALGRKAPPGHPGLGSRPSYLLGGEELGGELDEAHTARIPARPMNHVTLAQMLE